MVVSPYTLKIAPAALRHIKQLSPKHQKNIILLAEALAINPRPPGSKKIEGMTGLYCEAVNQLRLIYKIEDQEILLLMIRGC
jgi:mRNA interferase RelE/StbE